ncbi:hypothetical protein DCCM_0905 [Desulfocucumis palustris]|uniref:Sporulation protein YtxC n=1 Tax=Desulfocucumis palustris TaxID=1898651 RepID=A0A2L2X911_9FIRM|nr:putative sporulation protein YtxC [Desulfocucumis palustris]GBF32709.1 hypothetical protein DCCM_0905 [Desulfocucumis palustris]
MAQAISIGATRNIGELKDTLSRELRFLENQGLKVKLEENPTGKITFLSCEVSNRSPMRFNEDALAVFKRYVAQALSDLILGQWEKLLLTDIIRENYYYFNEEERGTIYRYASSYINHGEDGQSFYRIARRNKIVHKILEFLRSNDDIVIDGFIRFRLKEYVNELQEAADRAVDDFLMEREYNEFIQLLKYFVEIQDPRLDLVHVLIKPNGVFKLFDGQYQVINSEYLEGFMMELVDSEINYEDMLISTLITLAPREIIFHLGKGERPQNTLETIKQVFLHRVKECTDCELCKGTLDEN